MEFIKLFFLAAIIFWYGCNTPDTLTKTTADSANITVAPDKAIAEESRGKMFSNERFKNVSVSKITEDSFAISGKARVFEAVFNWVLNEGNIEIKSGHQMTGAGAPEWGDLVFGLTIPGRADSTLHLVLFESSAKDGSRVSELTIPLEQAQ